MAGDLIPPPSPAGRPAPDAPRLIELPPETPKPAGAERPPEPVGPSAFRNRFGFLLGALIGVVVAAAAVAVVVLTTSGGDDSHAGMAKNWSAWKPSSSDVVDGAQQIAQHVGTRYHLRDGHQLVAVTGGPLEIQSVPLNVALRPPSGNIQLISGNGLLYTLNGLGPRGSIIGGKPSAQRLLLLRREALELALYSFRYLKDVDMVVALLPPSPPKKCESAAQIASQPTYALFYRPGDLSPQLQVPLKVTIPPKTPTPETIGGQEARRVDSLTRSNFFEASVQQAQDAKAYLVLARPQPQKAPC